MNAVEIRGLVQELVDENPFAVRALLKIVRLEFTDRVPTMAVTAESQPRLLINRAFVAAHCSTPEHVKAVLCHEFLHVLLRHTTLPGPLTPARHLALDAVINAIIHRQLGEPYSGMMARYYARAAGLGALLRPMTGDERARYARSQRHDGRERVPPWWTVWHRLYSGHVLADDLEALAEQLSSDGAAAGRTPGVAHGYELPDAEALLGNHSDEPLASEALERALERARSELNGGGIWRSAGPGGHRFTTRVEPRDAALAVWRERTLGVLRRHLQPTRDGARRATPIGARLPVPSPSDRRAFLRTTWSPFLPEATWEATAQRPEGRAQVYLDVSGSMNAEMPLIVALLARLQPWIRRPFWAFSTHVAPAVIERGVLKTDTTGGTSLVCVLQHVATTRPSSAVIVTDGFVDAVPRDCVEATRRTRLHAVVTRDGNPAALKAAGIPYSQLGRLPT
jgi:hypothetical protein